MNYNSSRNKPRLSAAECFRPRPRRSDRHYRWHAIQLHRPLNNLVGEMIDTTITRNQSRGVTINHYIVYEVADMPRRTASVWHYEENNVWRVVME